MVFFRCRFVVSFRKEEEEQQLTWLQGWGQSTLKVSHAAQIWTARSKKLRAHPDFFIFQSLRGEGAALPPRLLSALGSHRDRYDSDDEVQKHSGIAPVTEMSGKKKGVHFRWTCAKFMRQSFHAWAGHSIAQSVWARAYYQQRRERGNDHHAAVRALAFKWIRIVFRCWQDGVAYDEAKYLAALARRGSP